MRGTFQRLVQNLRSHVDRAGDRLLRVVAFTLLACAVWGLVIYGVFSFEEKKLEGLKRLVAEGCLEEAERELKEGKRKEALYHLASARTYLSLLGGAEDLKGRVSRLEAQLYRNEGEKEGGGYKALFLSRLAERALLAGEFERAKRLYLRVLKLAGNSTLVDTKALQLRLERIEYEQIMLGCKSAYMSGDYDKALRLAEMLERFARLHREVSLDGRWRLCRNVAFYIRKKRFLDKLVALRLEADEAYNAGDFKRAGGVYRRLIALARTSAFREDPSVAEVVAYAKRRLSQIRAKAVSRKVSYAKWMKKHGFVRVGNGWISVDEIRGMAKRKALSLFYKKLRSLARSDGQELEGLELVPVSEGEDLFEYDVRAKFLAHIFLGGWERVLCTARVSFLPSSDTWRVGGLSCREVGLK